MKEKPNSLTLSSTMPSSPSSWQKVGRRLAFLPNTLDRPCWHNWWGRRGWRSRWHWRSASLCSCQGCLVCCSTGIRACLRCWPSMAAAMATAPTSRVVWCRCRGRRWVDPPAIGPPAIHTQQKVSKMQISTTANILETKSELEKDLRSSKSCYWSLSLFAHQHSYGQVEASWVRLFCATADGQRQHNLCTFTTLWKVNSFITWWKNQHTHHQMKKSTHSPFSELIGK